MGTTFTVTPESLMALGSLLEGTLAQVDQLKTWSAVGWVEAMGGPEIEDAVSTFSGDWSKVMDSLSDAIGSLVEGLIKSAMAYNAAEQDAQIKAEDVIRAQHCLPPLNPEFVVGP